MNLLRVDFDFGDLATTETAELLGESLRAEFSFPTGGPKGDKGDTGDVGPAGATGAAGAKGDKGDTGAVGPAGPAGAAGTQGPAGAKGDKGDTGDVGPAGATGAKGDKGDTGDVGPSGASNWNEISGKPASFSPSQHASTHHTGGTDVIAPDNISAAWALAVSSQFISSNTLLSAGRNRRITLSAVNQTVNVDLPYSGNADGDVVTLVASSGLFTGSTLSIRTATGVSGGLPVTYATLATLTAPNQSFTFVSNGTATGWTLRAVDTHTHGNLSSTGTLGSTSGLPVVTTTSGAITTLALGAANTVLKVNSGGTGVEFGEGGGVDDYTVITSSQTATNGARIAANTTAGAFTLTLPASPSNGDTVSILDYAGTFDTNNLTIARNGSNIESLAEDMDCNIEDAAFSLVYVGSTVGWKVVPFSGTAIPINQQANDIEITDSAKGVIMKSPNNTRWRLTINDNGTLQRVALPLIAFLCMTASALSQNVTDVVANTNGVLVAPTNFFTANLAQWVTGSYVYAPTNNFSVTNSTTLTNIPSGSFTVSANTSYIYIASAYLSGSNGYHVAIELPSIANAVITNTASSGLYVITGGTATPTIYNTTSNIRILQRNAAQTTNNPSFAIGTFRVGATGGTANLQFAQGASSANPSEITAQTRVLIFPLP